MKMGGIGMRAKTLKSAWRTVVAGALAGCLCLGTALGIDGERRAFAANPGNSWQIGGGAYDSSHSTSEGLSPDQLSNYNFIESDDGAVRVTKTLEPTGTEDEFIVHLSADTSAISVQVTDYKTYFENAPYMGTTSNNYHSTDPGTVITNPTGNMDVRVGGNVSVGSNNGLFNIKDPQGRPIAENVRLYWSQANNITILLEVDTPSGKKYVIMGVKVRNGETNDLQLSEEAYKLIQEAIAGKVEPGSPAELNSVTDVMGDKVDYLGSAVPDGGMASYDDASRTLTWNPKYNDSYKEVAEDPVVVEERNEHGAVTKVTITQKTWYYGAASLTYKVRLNTQANDFKSSYNPTEVTNAYYTNNRATLNYAYSTDGGHTTQNGSIDFPKPQVKGITYDLRAQKWNKDDAAPLAGATFSLTRSWTDSDGAAHNDLVSNSLVSDEDGYVTVTGLPWGLYTLTETAAPSGFVLPTDTVRTFDLCYTTGAGDLTASNMSAESDHRAMLAVDAERIDNKRVRTNVQLLKVDADDNSKTLSGAKFALYKDNGDGSFDAASDELVSEQETNDAGRIQFDQLTVGTYFLKETYAPTGYQLNENVYRILVFDVKGQAGGVEDNMIQVGKVDGADMRASETPNTVTIADKPNPVMPVTAGPGSRDIVSAGFGMLAAGAMAYLASTLHARRHLSAARHAARWKGGSVQGRRVQ